MVSLILVIVSVAFFLGHPVYELSSNKVGEKYIICEGSKHLCVYSLDGCHNNCIKYDDDDMTLAYQGGGGEGHVPPPPLHDRIYHQYPPYSQLIAHVSHDFIKNS